MPARGSDCVTHSDVRPTVNILHHLRMQVVLVQRVHSLLLHADQQQQQQRSVH